MQRIFIRNLRLHRGDILLLDGFVDLVPVDGNMRWSFDSKPDIIAADPMNLNLNFIPDELIVEIVSFNMNLVAFGHAQKRQVKMP